MMTTTFVSFDGKNLWCAVDGDHEDVFDADQLIVNTDETVPPITLDALRQAAKGNEAGLSLEEMCDLPLF